MRKDKLGIIFISVFAVLFLLLIKNTGAQTTASSSDSADAIGVRIIPNPNHYSISRWYESQGFTGSPQSLVVDGYDAIRDGRTVYVNAANLKGKLIYTNIYLISYNQDPSTKTVDILGQIVKNWKFNSDLVEKTNPGPTCAISSLPCSSDTDCGSDQYCATSTIAANSCQLKVVKNCLTDENCPQNFFCDSVKSKIIRDVKRIGETEDIKEALSNYYIANKAYPLLSAGTYLSGNTVSVWPSWSDTFLSSLSMSQNFIDPINRLGACSGYDVKTCWNQDTKRFVYDPQTNYLMLPSGSYGFVYKTDTNGSNYSLCAVMETREQTANLNYQFSPNTPASSTCVVATGIISGGTATNTPPVMLDSYLSGQTEQAFSGYFKVNDLENNPLTWSLDTSAQKWTGWSAAPVLVSTNNPYQKKIVASSAGNPGNYNVLLTVSDGQGGVLKATSTIVIINIKPFIEADNGEFNLNPANQFSYSFYFSGSNIVNADNAYSVTKLSGPADFNLLDFKSTVTPAGLNRYEVTYQGTVDTKNKLTADTDYTYRIKVTDKYKDTATKDFKITLKPEAPNLIFDCLSGQRIGKAYSCFLGYTEQDNHQLSYTSTELPIGLKLVASATEMYISGTSTATFNQGVEVRATNEYGAYSTKSFSLSVNNYCGDGVKQSPNTEGRGGIYNDGYEDCDGIDGISLDNHGQPVVSNDPAKQYGCTTYSDNTPYPIPNGNYCVFKSPADGGGYCGDGICQVKVNYNGVDVAVEDETNCPSDCVSTPVCVPKCQGRTCGNDGCGGSCGSQCNSCGNGTCDSGETVANCPADCAYLSCCVEPSINGCAYSDEHSCNQDVRCSWDTTSSIPACNVKPYFDPSCWSQFTEADCNSKKQSEGCTWVRMSGGGINSSSSCNAQASCGDGVCNNGETCNTCSADCSNCDSGVCLGINNCSNWGTQFLCQKYGCTWNQTGGSNRGVI